MSKRTVVKKKVGRWNRYYILVNGKIDGAYLTESQLDSTSKIVKYESSMLKPNMTFSNKYGFALKSKK
jgi:hypothetical protein